MTPKYVAAFARVQAVVRTGSGFDVCHCPVRVMVVLFLVVVIVSTGNYSRAAGAVLPADCPLPSLCRRDDAGAVVGRAMATRWRLQIVLLKLAI